MLYFPTNQSSMSGDANERPIIAILGPTATGKTAAAIALAELLEGEIISADSMAVYRGLDVGTAKPTVEEQKQATFHLIDVADPRETFNAAQFNELASRTLNEIRVRGKQSVLAGGTGLYVRAFLEGYGLTATPADPVLREQLNREAREQGTAALYERLRSLDPEAAARIHINDRIRIVRALEVCITTGAPISEQHRSDAEQRKRRPAMKFGLTARREELYRRIDARVDRMISLGLESEVRSLMGRGLDASTQSLRSLGYKEMVGYISGESDMEAAIETIKQNTRRFAKRQLTWFRADKEIEWIDVEDKSPAEVAQLIAARIDH